MAKSNNFGIDMSMAAQVVDALLYEGKAPNYDLYRSLLRDLRSEDCAGIVDLSHTLVPTLLEIIRRACNGVAQKVVQMIPTVDLMEEDGQQQLKDEISMNDLKLISAIRVLGVLRDAKAEKALENLALDRSVPVAARITAIRALLKACESQAIEVIAKILEAASAPIGVVCRMTLIEGEERISMVSDQSAEPDILLRECVDLLGKSGLDAARRLLLSVRRRTEASEELRSLASDLLRDGRPRRGRATYGVVKVVSYLR